MKMMMMMIVLLLIFFSADTAMAQPNNNTNTHTNTTPVNVGVILDVNNDEFGKIWLSCINMALSDFYTNSHDYRTRLLLNVRDSKTDVVAAAAAGERVISNLGRFVVIMWFFVVLILTQSYTASLTSHLTVQQLAITDVRELIRSGENVGYQKGSFVSGILKQLGFNENKLIEYNSPEECDELFKKGSAKGGRAAAFDEVPYMRLFIGQYCTKYQIVCSMTEQTFMTTGFGFVFPLNSPLVVDVSRAILNVTRSEKMNEIEDVYFKKRASCPDSRTLVSSNSLDLNSFWGLFLIAGIAAILALIIFMAIFVYEHRNVLKKSDPRTSIWTRIRVLSRIFISKDLSAHTFKDKSGTGVTDHEPSPITHHYSASPSIYSHHSDFALCGEQGTPSTENNDPNPNLNDQATQQIVHVVQVLDPNPEISKVP